MQFDERINLEIMERFTDEGSKLAPPTSKTYLRQEDGRPIEGTLGKDLQTK